MEQVILSDRSCGKAISLLLVPTPKGNDALMDALRGGLPGTLDKVITARFSGVFRWQPDKTPKAMLSVEEISEVRRDPYGRTDLQEFQDEAAEATKRVLTVCALTKNFLIFDGQMVLVEGTYRSGAHKTNLTDSACPGVELILRGDLGHTALKSARTQQDSLAEKGRKQPIEVVFRGIFRVVPDPRCHTSVCARYEIETKELVSSGAPFRAAPE